jgi:thiol-disulfide isomerase/thioredoxin
VREVRALIAIAALSLCACEYVERPRRGLPEHFEAKALTGQTIDRETLKGNPWAVVLWVPDCGPCQRELPQLEALHTKWSEKGVRFLALSLEPDTQQVEDKARELNLSMQVAIARSEVLGPFGVNQVPSMAFLRSDGMINAVGTGFKDTAWIERRLAEVAPSPALNAAN